MELADHPHYQRLERSPIELDVARWLLADDSSTVAPALDLPLVIACEVLAERWRPPGRLVRFDEGGQVLVVCPEDRVSGWVDAFFRCGHLGSRGQFHLPPGDERVSITTPEGLVRNRDAYLARQLAVVIYDRLAPAGADVSDNGDEPRVRLWRLLDEHDGRRVVERGWLAWPTPAHQTPLAAHPRERLSPLAARS